jgi:hypothetical protein
MDSQNTTVLPDIKGPLQSKTQWLAAITLAAGLVAKLNPDAGMWIKDNSDTLMLLIGGVLPLLRHQSGPIDWKNWTIFGIGKKF